MLLTFGIYLGSGAIFSIISFIALITHPPESHWTFGEKMVICLVPIVIWPRAVWLAIKEKTRKKLL